MSDRTPLPADRSSLPPQTDDSALAEAESCTSALPGGVEQRIRARMATGLSRTDAVAWTMKEMLT